MITPKFYFQRGKKSDRDWIERCMSSIPENRQQEVADKYEKLYEVQRSRHVGRKSANTYLLNVAQECRQDKYGKQKKEM